VPLPHTLRKPSLPCVLIEEELLNLGSPVTFLSTKEPTMSNQPTINHLTKITASPVGSGTVRPLHQCDNWTNGGAKFLFELPTSSPSFPTPTKEEKRQKNIKYRTTNLVLKQTFPIAPKGEYSDVAFEDRHGRKIGWTTNNNQPGDYWTINDYVEGKCKYDQISGLKPHWNNSDRLIKALKQTRSSINEDGTLVGSEDFHLEQKRKLVLLDLLIPSYDGKTLRGIFIDIDHKMDKKGLQARFSTGYVFLTASHNLTIFFPFNSPKWNYKTIAELLVGSDFYNEYVDINESAFTKKYITENNAPDFANYLKSNKYESDKGENSLALEAVVWQTLQRREENPVLSVGILDPAPNPVLLLNSYDTNQKPLSDDLLRGLDLKLMPPELKAFKKKCRNTHLFQTLSILGTSDRSFDENGDGFNLACRKLAQSWGCKDWKIANDTLGAMLELGMIVVASDFIAHIKGTGYIIAPALHELMKSWRRACGLPEVTLRAKVNNQNLEKAQAILNGATNDHWHSVFMRTSCYFPTVQEFIAFLDTNLNFRAKKDRLSHALSVYKAHEANNKQRGFTWTITKQVDTRPIYDEPTNLQSLIHYTQTVSFSAMEA
jgi:hypothetical protein